jgi:hypothetical protein
MFERKMLKLSIVHADPGGPAVPNPMDPGVEVWHENDGTVCAYGYTANGQHWMHFPGLGSYCFSNHSDEVMAFAEPFARLDWLRDTFYRSVLPMALQVFGKEVLHASAVETAYGAIAFCAISESGKSTIGYGLSRRGHPLWADDAVVFEISDREVWAHPMPFEIRLRPASAQYFRFSQIDADNPTNCDLVSQVNLKPRPLAAVCLLERGDRLEPVRIRRILPIHAFPAVLSHAYCFSLQDMERKRRMMHAYLALVREVPVFTIRFAAGLEALPRLLDSIEQKIIHGIACDPRSEYAVSSPAP